MSKLDDILDDCYAGDVGWTHDQLDGTSLLGLELEAIEKKKLESKDDIKTLIREIIGDLEQRETDDSSLKSWTPEDYKAFGRNELRVKLLGEVDKL